jgi:hypothetical protein
LSYSFGSRCSFCREEEEEEEEEEAFRLLDFLLSLLPLLLPLPLELFSFASFWFSSSSSSTRIKRTTPALLPFLLVAFAATAAKRR